MTNTGRVKWFDRKKGYGFIMPIQEGGENHETNNEEGEGIFVHQLAIHPQKDVFRYLVKNEYVDYNYDEEKRRATDVVGHLGQPLLCELHTERKMRDDSRPRPPAYKRVGKTKNRKSGKSQGKEQVIYLKPGMVIKATT